MLPQHQQVVSAPVAGLVNQILVEANQNVRAGTPVLALNSPDLGQLQLAAIQAANRARLTIAATRREQALFDEGIIAERRVMEAKSAESDAQAELAQAKAALLLAGLTVAEVDKVVDSGTAQKELRVYAQMGGTVTAVAVKPGQRVALADPLVTIAQLDSLRVDIQVPSAQAAQWPPGSRVTIVGGAEREPDHRQRAERHLSRARHQRYGKSANGRVCASRIADGCCRRLGCPVISISP